MLLPSLISCLIPSFPKILISWHRVANCPSLYNETGPEWCLDAHSFLMATGLTIGDKDTGCKDLVILPIGWIWRMWLCYRAGSPSLLSSGCGGGAAVVPAGSGSLSVAHPHYPVCSIDSMFIFSIPWLGGFSHILKGSWIQRRIRVTEGPCVPRSPFHVLLHFCRHRQWPGALGSALSCTSFHTVITTAIILQAHGGTVTNNNIMGKTNANHWISRSSNTY